MAMTTAGQSAAKPMTVGLQDVVGTEQAKICLIRVQRASVEEKVSKEKTSSGMLCMYDRR